MLAVRQTSAVLKDEQQARIRIGQLDQIISKLYEDSALGKIPIERFNIMFQKYEAEQKDLKIRVDEADRIRRKQSEKTEKLRSFTDFVKEVSDITELTPDILHKLVKRITIGQAKANPVTNEKEQAIEVEFALS